MNADGSSGAPELEASYLLVVEEAFEIFKQRQRKYGPDNIAEFREVGCLIRASDKQKRLRLALLQHIGMDSEDEKVDDSWIDWINYGIIALMCMRGLWPEYQEEMPHVVVLNNVRYIRDE